MPAYDWIAMAARRLFFEAAYLFGWKPWDSGVPPPELVELIEGPNALKPRRAIDLGCGTGTNCRYMVDHGWEVTGVDYVARALNAAKRKAPQARLLVGDVTRLAELGVDGPFDLLLDLGCFHSITDDRRQAYVREGTRAARCDPLGDPAAVRRRLRCGRSSRRRSVPPADVVPDGAQVGMKITHRRWGLRWQRFYG